MTNDRGNQSHPPVIDQAARSQEPIAPETDAAGNQCLAPPGKPAS